MHLSGWLKLKQHNSNAGDDVEKLDHPDTADENGKW